MFTEQKNRELSWRQVKKNEVGLLAEIVEKEKVFPVFLRNSYGVWQKEDAVQYFQNCHHLLGIFDQEKIIGLVYFEQITPLALNVHFDVERGYSIKELLPVLSEIRDFEFLGNVQTIMTFILKKNRAIRYLIEQIGFTPTFLKMRYGNSHSKTLEWQQFCIVRG